MACDLKDGKILVIRFSSLGDVVLTTALFPNLKSRWPGCEVTVLTKADFADVFERNPFVDHVRIFDKKRQSFSQLAGEIRNEHFDVVVDLHGNIRSWILRLYIGAPWTVVVEKARWARWLLVMFKRTSVSLNKSVRERILDCLKPLEIPVVKTDTQLFPDEKIDILSTFGVDQKMTLIGVAPGAKHATKRWSAERFAEAANRLSAVPNSMVVVLGDKNDKEVAEEVFRLVRAPCKNLAGWTSIGELVSVISHLSLLLTNDSAAMHMAEALDIPLVALFGPTVRALGFSPYRNFSKVVEISALRCRPCSLHGDERCPLKHHRCMKDIDVNTVVTAAAPLMENTNESVGLS